MKTPITKHYSLITAAKRLLTAFYLLAANCLLAQPCGSNSTPRNAQEEQAKQNWQANVNAYLSSHKQPTTNHQSLSTAVTIPVVVHVIHAGEAVGVGTNISDVQIYSQIFKLNEDYACQNQDTIDAQYPFGSLKANTQIQFCLASYDEGGQPTTGIERWDGPMFWGGTGFYTRADIDSFIKPISIWNPDLFLNIWVVNLNDNFLYAYSTFPWSSNNHYNDGVVCSYDCFGTYGNLKPNYDKGRVAVHEIGHYLGLTHIWGDAWCGDDNIADTPPQQQPNYGCPAFPCNGYNACGSAWIGEMYMNYMDYTYDACKNMFTQDQASVMQITIQAWRTSLLSSVGCGGPNSVAQASMGALTFSPNPSNGQTTLNNVPEGAQITITNALGQTVQNFVCMGGTQVIHLSQQAAGVYYVMLAAGNKTQTGKIIVQ